MTESIGIVGLGAVGHELSRDLIAAGHRVLAWDGRSHPGAPEAAAVTVERDPAAFLDRVDMVLVAVPGDSVLDVVRTLTRYARAGTVVGDMTAKSIDVRDQVADLCAAAACAYADVAIVDPVLPASTRIALLASGPGAEAIAVALTATRFSTTIGRTNRLISTEAKLCRSVFTKGLASLLLETMVVAERAGLTDVVVPGIIASMSIEFEQVIEILVGGWPRNAVRRAAEMSAADDFVRRHMSDPQMTPATREVFARVAAAGEVAGANSAAVAAAVARTSVFGMRADG
jgi:3-hydroxyisobutyrate dehydrogenase